MQITPTIRTEIQHFLRAHHLNMSQFASRCGLNAGTMSSMLNSNRPFSVHQLDCVTKAMEKPEDYYYSYYVQESMLEATVDWRRAHAFLQRCMELNRFDCISKVISVLMENVAYYAPQVFELAEDFFVKERYEAAEILYENLALSERQQHSERLAVCQYRLFKIRIRDDQSQNLRAATLFEVFVERLDELQQLDALKDLANVYRSLREWDKVQEVAIKMRAKANIQYRMKHQQNSRKRVASYNQLSRPLFVYITYADLLCASVCEARGDYQQALKYTYAYATLDWVKETDETSVHWVSLFQHWAEGNTYVNKLLSGNVSVLNDYVEYIAASSEKEDKEMISRLLNIMLAANRYSLDVNDVLERFGKFINTFAQQNSTDMYSKQVITEQRVRLNYELAKYYMRNEMYGEGFTFLISCLDQSSLINNKSYLYKSVRYESYETYASPETKAAYRQFISIVD